MERHQAPKSDWIFRVSDEIDMKYILLQISKVELISDVSMGSHEICWVFRDQEYLKEIKFYGLLTNNCYKHTPILGENPTMKVHYRNHSGTFDPWKYYKSTSFPRWVIDSWFHVHKWGPFWMDIQQ